MKIAKKGKLYELSFDKKWKFMESLKKVKEKYTIESIDEKKIKDYLYFNKNNVLRETNKHFKSVTDTQVKRKNELEQFWREEYAPREDIDENIYKDLLIDIKEEKWLTAIKNLNKNKAGGISQITYDILQECT